MGEWIAGLRPEQRDLARVFGAVTLLAGALGLFIRKSSHHQWGSFGRLLVVLIPCVVLFALGLEAAEQGGVKTPPLDRGLLVSGKRVAPAWQSIHLVLGILLVPFVLLQFVDLLGGNTSDSLNAAWIFLVTAAIAFYLALAFGVSYAALLGALALIVSWLTLWDKLASPSASTDRWLLLMIGAFLLAVAVQLERERLRYATEFVTAAGLAGLAAGVLGLISAAISFVGTSISRAFGSPSVPGGGVRQHQEWDIFLLALALALIWYGNRRGARGPTYVGGFALGAFIISVGIELTRVLSGTGQAHGDLIGWPALLFIFAVAGLGVGFWRPPVGPAVALTESPPGPPPPPQQP